jgi:large subunit ribosomal protein L9
MKVLLTESVQKVGKAGELVSVSDGYARNFLIPQRKAVPATPKSVKAFEHQKRVVADKLRKEMKEVEAVASQLGAVSLTVPAQVGEEGKLFGSVTNRDVAEALEKQGFTIDKRKILLENPIKELGEYTILIELDHDVKAEIKLSVVKADSAAG